MKHDLMGWIIGDFGLFLGKILKEARSKQHILRDVTHSKKQKTISRP